MASNNKTNTNAMNQNYQSQNQSRGAGNLKYEVAQELGVELGPDTSARNNGRVGGSITRELVNRAKQSTDTEAMKYETSESKDLAEMWITSENLECSVDDRTFS